MKKNTSFLLIVISFFSCFYLNAIEIDKEKDQIATLEYGIDTDVQLLLKTLSTEKEYKYNDKIISILKTTKSNNLKESIFKYFTEIKDKLAEDFAIEEVVNAKENPASTIVNSCLFYLGEINSTKAEESLLGLIESSNKNLAILSIRTLGKLKAKSVGKAILAKLDDANYDEKLKGDLIWTLGEIEYIDATKQLTDLLDEYTDKPANKQLVLEALGKFKTPDALKTILKYVNDENALVRARSINSLMYFTPNAEISTYVVNALRDNQTAVRLAAIDAVSKFKDNQFIPSIQYKIKKDPENAVKIKALRCLIDWDTSLAMSTVKDLLLDKSIDLRLWNECLNIAIEKDIGGLQSIISEVLQREASEKFSPYPDIITKALSMKTKSSYEEVYRKLLAQDKNRKILAINGISVNKIKALEPNLRALINDPKEDETVKSKAKDCLKLLGFTP